MVILAVLAFAAITFFAIAQTSSAAGPRDCDDNAILNCGVYSISELKQKYDSADAKAKGAYDYFGVKRSDFDSLKNGYVTKDGKVVVNGKTVATNILSSGRNKTPNSKQIPGGAYVRPPSDSFLSSQIDAYVMMEGDRFLYAIIKSCGNPAGGGKVERTKLDESKSVSPSNGSKVVPGQKITYTLTVKNTSGVYAQNVTITDYIPKGTTYVNRSAGSVSGAKYDNVAVRDGYIRFYWERIPAGQTRVVKFDVTVNGNVAGGTDICNKATTDATGETPDDTNQVCNEVETPIVACTSLTATPATGTAPLDLKFLAKSSATAGAKQTKYEFDYNNDGKIDRTVNHDGNSLSVNYTYANPGDYKAKVFVTFTLPNGTTKRVSNANCEVPVKVTQRVIPVAQCTSLTATQLNSRYFQFTAKASAKDGATINGYTVNFGDGSEPVRQNGVNNNVFLHQYPNSDEAYTATLTVHTSEGNRTSENCIVTVRVSELFVSCVDLTAEPKSGMAPLTTRFNVQAAASDEIVILAYAVDLNGNGVYDEGVDRTITTNERSVEFEETFTENATVAVAVIGTDAAGEEIYGDINEAGDNVVFTDACKEVITVDQPELVCAGLTKERLSEYTYRFVITTEGNLEVDEYEFEVNGKVVATQEGNSYEHTFEEGTHTIRARALAGDTATNFDDCKTTVTITEFETPPELPKTGPASAASAFFGTTALGQGVRMWLLSRKKLFGALLGN